MVDSSIGGKTAVDTPAGKNLIGAFHRAKGIYLDLEVLETLPEREFINGFAEIIKIAACRDSKLFELLEDNADRLLSDRRDPLFDKELLRSVVLRAAGLKMEIVALDEKEESGLRSILNWGHTIGHAVEALKEGKMLHGECVAIGCVAEAKIAAILGHLSSSSTSSTLVGRVISCLQCFGLPVSIPKDLGVGDLLKKMSLDKKNTGKKVRITMIKSIGDCFESPLPVEPSAIRRVLLPGIIVKGPSSSFLPGGAITPPGSKSISNRILLLTAMAEGECRLKGLLHADDTHVMLDALQKMGARFRWEDHGETLVVIGNGGKFHPPAAQKPLFLGNAGTASRFLTSSSLLIEGEPGKDNSTILTGSARLKERPIRDLVEALQSNGCEVGYLEKEGYFPLKITGHGLPGGVIHLSASLSSQFVSSLLISAPYAQKDVDLQLKGEAVSQPYIDMTTSLMEQFGATVKREKGENGDRYLVPRGIYKNPANFTVEADASSASYPLAIAAITGGEVTVTNMGSRSLQGDSQFYRLLEKMGCEVSQTETTTTVKGPPEGKLLRAIDVDMSSLTDTFMTICALAAVAEGTTSIRNISNQRVKECNRIEAMVNEFKKLGVIARELPDGIQVEGVAGQVEKIHPEGVSIHCYNDHRIAMSFAVLGCKVSGILISDKDCVDKTYPEFWLDIEKRLGIQLDSPSVPELEEDSESPRRNIGHECKVVVLVGMRGVGKSSMGSALSGYLGWDLVDTDEEFVKVKGSIKEFTTEHGWATFRTEEEKLLRDIIIKLEGGGSQGTVIVTGGGIVETLSGRKFLAELWKNQRKDGARAAVIQLTRHIEDIITYIESDPVRAILPGGETTLQTWNRRKPYYLECSQFEFSVLKGENNWKLVEKKFFSFVERILDRLNTFGTFLDWTNTFFLSLTFPDLRYSLPVLQDISQGVSALEVRVDLLNHHLDLDEVSTQVTWLRRHTDLPLIFTVRSLDQGGKFNSSEAKMFELLRLGGRLACEFVDVEACWSLGARSRFLEGLPANHDKRVTAVISSFHDFKSIPTPELIQKMTNLCLQLKGSDVIKIIAFAHQFSDNHLVGLASASTSPPSSLPFIAICAGERGKISRVANDYLTPVTHPLLPYAAAPGQMSVEQLISLRSQLFLGAPAQFFIFGSTVARSPSPAMHNAGFAFYQLAYSYSRFETPEIEEVVKKLREPTTKGGSVTIPHKQTIMPHLDSITMRAKAVGAVNTVLKDSKGSLLGDNTDWLAIRDLVQKRLEERGAVSENRKQRGLVVGAGGTAYSACYALAHLGLELLVFNRTVKKAKELASKFKNVKVITTLEQMSEDVDIVISTLPPDANFQLPTAFIARYSSPSSSITGPVLMDVVYGMLTSLLKQAQELRWKSISGTEMVLEQGLVQFELWTHRRAPRDVIEGAVNQTTPLPLQ
jgi:pentafunctional AROM polypeptide